MHCGVVSPFEFFKVNCVVLVDVEGFKGTLNQASSELVHVSDDNSYELIETNLSTSVKVQRFEKTFHVLRIDIDAKVVDCFRELRQIEVTGAIVISNFKLSLEADDASGASCFQSFSKPFDKDALELWYRWLSCHSEFLVWISTKFLHTFRVYRRSSLCSLRWHC